MPKLEALFEDFDLYNEAAKNWNLDFKLLSSNDFSAYLHIFNNSYFELARTKLTGKIIQHGLTPNNFRSIVVPVPRKSNFIWLNHKVNQSNILIFPKTKVLDAVSFSDFDVYIISIKETVLYEMLNSLQYGHAEKLFNEGIEKVLKIESDFAYFFHKKANEFLKGNIKGKYSEQSLINNLIFYVLKGLEENKNIVKNNSLVRNRDKALQKAVNLINLSGKRHSLQELCNISGVSERTLEYAFLEKYKITPISYIKAHRLNMVRKELVLSKGKKVKISAIAANYDFWHMGQFAKDFKKHFGVLPSQILNA